MNQLVLVAQGPILKTINASVVPIPIASVAQAVRASNAKVVIMQVDKIAMLVAMVVKIVIKLDVMFAKKVSLKKMTTASHLLIKDELVFHVKISRLDVCQVVKDVILTKVKMSFVYKKM